MLQNRFDIIRILVLAGWNRPSSFILQWFKLEHCCYWQDCDPVWPELSEHPAPPSLWYTSQCASSVNHESIFALRKENLNILKSYSDMSMPFTWIKFQLLFQLPHMSFWIFYFFLRNWCGCYRYMPGWTVFGGLWKKRKSAFDICSTEENSSHKGKSFPMIL